MLCAVKGFGGEDERIKRSREAILGPIDQALRRAQFARRGRHDRVKVVLLTFQEKCGRIDFAVKFVEVVDAQQKGSRGRLEST
jgi:hypothetical protein